MPSIVRALVIVIVFTLATACDDGGGDGGVDGDLEYYCYHYSNAYCQAYSECDPINFMTYFASVDQCADQTEADCLDPPEGRSRCGGATPEETDICVEYFETNSPDGCHNLFGPSKDLSLCEDIC